MKKWLQTTHLLRSGSRSRRCRVSGWGTRIRLGVNQSFQKFDFL